MKIRSINPTNISRLRNAFYDFLLENAVPFHTIGVTEEDDQLILYFKKDDNLNVFKFDKEACIGQEPEFIAETVIQPMLKRLQGKE